MEIFLFCRHDHLDGDILGNFVSSKRPPHKSKPVPTVPAESPAVAPAWEKKDKLQPAEPSLDTKRVGEKFRTKSGLIVRGLTAGPIASCPQVVAPSCFVRVGSVNLPGCMWGDPQAAPEKGPEQWGWKHTSSVFSPAACLRYCQWGNPERARPGSC